MSENQVRPRIVAASAGPVVRAFGEEVQFCLTGEQTGYRLTMWIETVPPDGGPPPHRHLNEEEWFVVLEGEFQFLVEGEWETVDPGTTVYLPKGAVHTFKNIGSTFGKLLVSTSPSGFETFFTRCAEVFHRPGPPDMPEIMKIAAEHGIEFLV